MIWGHVGGDVRVEADRVVLGGDAGYNLLAMTIGDILIAALRLIPVP